MTDHLTSNEKVSVIEALRLLRALTREVDAPIERAAVDLLESEIDRLRDVEALTRTTHEPSTDQSDIDFLAATLVDQESVLDECEKLLKESLAEDGVECGFDRRLEQYWQKRKALADWRSRELRLAEPPPAVDVAPIAKLTVRDGLVQRAGLYAPGLPDGDHDVFPVPLSPKGELRPHVLAEPPTAWRPIETAPQDGRNIILAHYAYVTEGYRRIDGVHVSHQGDKPLTPFSHWMPLPSPPVTKSAVQEYQKASLSICEHPHVDFGRCTYCDAVVGAAVETKGDRT